MKIIEPKTAPELQKYYDLRFEILRKPWKQPYSSTKDQWEDQSIHVLMLNDQEEAVACGRLQMNSKEEGQIRSMAVREEWQGKGLGSNILAYIEDRARKLNLKKIILDARGNAVKFYEKCGYRVIGDSYILFGSIKHFRMEKMMDMRN